MPNWSESMQQTFEFYMVDPVSFTDKKPLRNVTACTINRDSEAETLGSATFDITESVGESYIRVYLVTIQNGVTEKHPLGTYIVQTPSSKFDGRVRTVSMDAYTPLLELKERQPDLGYYIPKGEDVMDHAYRLTREYGARNNDARVGKPPVPSTELAYDFVADEDDTWLSFISDLITAAYTSTVYKVIDRGDAYVRAFEVLDPKSVWGEELTDENGKPVKTSTGETVFEGYDVIGAPIHYCTVTNLTKYRLDIDEMGRILFAPQQETKSLQPVWTYNDDNSSILHPSLSMDHDLYGVPNVVEVIYSDGAVHYKSVVENHNENSPVSIEARGRKICHRVTNPEIYGTPSQERIDQYAEQLLDALSSVEYTVTYTHGYCPVRINDCVRLNYTKAGLTNVKAKVISQSIECTPGCPVTETAVFTANLRG